MIDINEINYIKIDDIVGDGSCVDSAGNPIYDPYPTSESGGFDLNAIGVLNQVPEPASTWRGIRGCVACDRRVRKKKTAHSKPFSKTEFGRVPKLRFFMQTRAART